MFIAWSCSGPRGPSQAVDHRRRRRGGPSRSDIIAAEGSFQSAPPEGPAAEATPSSAAGALLRIALPPHSLHNAAPRARRPRLRRGEGAAPRARPRAAGRGAAAARHRQGGPAWTPLTVPAHSPLVARRRRGAPRVEPGAPLRVEGRPRAARGRAGVQREQRVGGVALLERSCSTTRRSRSRASSPARRARRRASRCSRTSPSRARARRRLRRRRPPPRRAGRVPARHPPFAARRAVRARLQSGRHEELVRVVLRRQVLPRALLPLQVPRLRLLPAAAHGAQRHRQRAGGAAAANATTVVAPPAVAGGANATDPAAAAAAAAAAAPAVVAAIANVTAPLTPPPPPRRPRTAGQRDAGRRTARAVAAAVNASGPSCRRCHGAGLKAFRFTPCYS